MVSNPEEVATCALLQRRIFIWAGWPIYDTGKTARFFFRINMVRPWRIVLGVKVPEALAETTGLIQSHLFLFAETAIKGSGPLLNNGVIKGSVRFWLLTSVRQKKYAGVDGSTVAH